MALDYFEADSQRYLTGLFVGLASILLAYRVYNVFFHPCAKYPGPWTRAAFHWPFWWDQLNGSYPLESHRLHQKYGPVVRIAPDRLSFATAAAFKDIHGVRKDRSQIPKDYKRFPIGAENYLPMFASNDADHSRFRRLLVHAFSESALREQESIIQKHIEGFVAQIGSSADGSGRVVDVDRWFEWLTFDILSDLMFGEAFGSVKAESTHKFIEDCSTGCNITPVLQMAWDYSIVHWLLAAFFNIPSIKLAQEGSATVNKARVQKRIDLGADVRKDFMTHILRHNNDESKPAASLGEIQGLATLILNAGGEEPAALMASAIYYLLKNPHVMQKAQKEIREIYASADDITFASAAQSAYLSAVIDETFRMRPPAAGHFSRRTVDETVIDGHVVPAKVSVVVSQYAAGHATVNFAEPEKFAPERWTPDAPAQYANDDRSAVQPFMQGPRGCIGKNLAMLMVRSTLAKLLWSYDMQFAESKIDWENQKFRTMWHRPGLMVTMSARSS